MLCFRKIAVPKKFMDQRGVGGYQEFLSKFLCLSVPKYFVKEPFCAVYQKISGCKNFMD